jgi:predicted secreted protein
MEMTAVEWLYNKMYEHKGIITITEYEQANEMEKQQIIDAFNKGFVTDQWDKSKENKSEQYYNEKFNKK